MQIEFPAPKRRGQPLRPHQRFKHAKVTDCPVELPVDITREGGCHYCTDCFGVPRETPDLGSFVCVGLTQVTGSTYEEFLDRLDELAEALLRRAWPYEGDPVLVYQEKPFFSPAYQAVIGYIGLAILDVKERPK